MIWLAIWLGIVVFSFQGIILDPIMAPHSVGGYFFATLFWLLICFITGALLFAAAYGIGESFVSKPDGGSTQTLVVIRDKDGIEGRFFLGSGYIDSAPYYFYYVQTADGGLRPGKVEANGAVTVYEQDRASAELVTYRWMMKPPTWSWIFCLPHEGSDKFTYAFRVPKGSVKREFRM